ncbi:K02A2.6-like [Cordylochernes scorpioides]|uniref:K02A2.6-like n=1 Tax=Cordylochernes scorpioides TaxID=51811 RepID=A0ABY6LLQ7_9ARAC|nr:K02A2.6-like [Cordylochernes scorpioides]
MQNINPPEQFNFNNPNEWPNWIKRFERFRKASELKSKKEEEQVNALIYILGEKAEDALISFNLTEIEINNYETVVKKFEEHFIGKPNVIFERAQFNCRYQQDGEAVEEYIRELHKMAENCNYGSLKEEMIRDRIVVGVKNLQLSEKLQLEPNLTLERAIQAACQTECVKQQQTILRSTTTQAANVDQVYEKKLPPSRFNSTFGKRDASKKSKFQKWSKPEKSRCIRCGASKFHPYKDCPAKEVKCHKCKKVGHFAKVCDNKTVGQVTQGADVNMIPQEIYFKNFAHKKLCKPDIQLLGPRQVKLHVMGKFTALIEKDGRSIPGEIFVVPQLMQPLLSGKASESLNLIKRLQSIEKRNSLNPFEEYPKLFTGLGTLQGSYTIKLKDESQPHAIYTPRRIPIPLLNKTKEQLDQMVEKGVIEKVEQPTDWCAPMVIVPKPSSNDLRICVDLTALNKFVKREHYPIPSVEYTLAQMGGAKLFSKLDANSGFWQIPLSEESSNLTTFLTPFGRYRFKRLPFGISSAPEVFQRKMSNLLESQSGVNCHMDDIVIWGATQEEHDERLRCVLRKLQDSGLTLNKEKCIFSVKEIKFLGHLITERGVLPDPNKVQAIREFPSPSSISEVRRFLGMVNFTGKFIPDLPTILYPLNQLLVKRNDWRWDSAQEEAFEKVKKLLSTSPALTLFDPNLPTTVSADASSYGLGAVLLQKSEDGYQKAVAYASRTMSETEKRWAQIEKESLAIVWACEKFQDYLMGNTFSIGTDHKPLIPIFSTKNLDEMTPRIQRLRLRMMRYSYSIHHTPGKDIVVADALSRSPIKISHEKDLENEICSFVQQITSCPPFKDKNMKEIWQYQNEERVCREIKDYCEKGWPTKNELSAEAKAFWCLRYEMSVIDGLLMRNSRIYIPNSLRSKVLNSLHEGHLGIEKCRGRARSSERSNPQQPLIVSDFPSRPWEKVGIDHFYLKGKYYLLIADYYSRFPELALLEDQTTHSTIMHCKSIFSRHGIPEEVRSDNGLQFGLEFKKFAKEYGFHHITSSPRFPQSNGFIESMVKNIKNQLKKGRDPYLSLLSYQTAPLENGYSPAELCMNRKLRTTVPTTPVQLQSRIPDLENLELREKYQRHKKKTHFDIHHRARELPHLDKGTRVWVKDLRVPGVVLEDAGSPRSYIVNSPKGILRRNRFHLLPNPQGEKIDMEDEEMESPEMKITGTSKDHEWTRGKAARQAKPLEKRGRCVEDHQATNSKKSHATFAKEKDISRKTVGSTLTTKEIKRIQQTKNNMASTRNYHKGPKQNKDTARSAIQERTEEPSQRRDSTSEYALHHKTEEKRSIQVAEEGRHIESASSGSIQATVQGKDKLNNAVTLHNVLHVPHLKGNLMSIPSVLIGTGNFDGNMYTLNLSRLSEATHVPNEHCLISKDNSRTAWHRRLGNPSDNKLDLILKNNLLKGLDSINGTLDQCDACSLGKMTKVPYVHTDSNQESYPFEAIYVDLCGPMRINSLGGSKYFLTIVDGFSRRIFVEFLKDKLSAAEVLKKFFVKRENELNSKLKRLRTDNGTEFINKNLETFIESKGIKHELTTPYTPRSNGRVERANRTLLGKG